MCGVMQFIWRYINAAERRAVLMLRVINIVDEIGSRGGVLVRCCTFWWTGPRVTHSQTTRSHANRTHGGRDARNADTNTGWRVKMELHIYVVCVDRVIGQFRKRLASIVAVKGGRTLMIQQLWCLSWPVFAATIGERTKSPRTKSPS